MIKLNFSRFKKLKPWFKYGLFVFLIVLLAGLFGWRVVDKPKPITPAIPPAVTAPVAVTYTDFHLLIPGLDISAPVIADVDGTKKTAYFKALEGGVAHYKDTAKPGEGGNIFIFGHSSYYRWAAGDYKEIFKSLEEIKKGDEIDVWWQNKEYQYIVASTKVVEPTDVSVLKPTKTEQLTLMTCVPPGTAEKRLIVVAKPK